MNINRRSDGWRVGRAYVDGLYSHEDCRRDKRALEGALDVMDGEVDVQDSPDSLDWTSGIPSEVIGSTIFNFGSRNPEIIG